MEVTASASGLVCPGARHSSNAFATRWFPSSRQRRLPRLRVDGHAFDGGVRIEHGFADGWMSVDGKHQFVDCAFEFHHRDGFGDEFSGLWTNDVNTEDFAVFGIGDNLDEAVVTAHNRGLGVAGEGELANLDFETALFGLGFR